MSPVVKRKGERFTLPSKYLLFILTILCTVMMLVTFGTNVFNRPFNRVVGYVIVPFEQGIAKAGEWLSNRSDELVQIRTLLAENSALKEQVASLTEENTLLQQDKYELNELRGLLELDEEYGDYNKIGARIISRDSGNWYSSFVIDKGSNDGLADDMNVIAGGGLVGIVTKTGPDWAQGRSIIDDMSNVSAMILKNSDLCYVRGDLEMMSEGTLQLNQLRDQNDEVESGDKVVTSYASAKYHKGILIGYVNELAVDSNNLTKSGSITPAVDFEHLSTVLVITDLKQQVDESQADATEEDTLLDETTETE